MLFRKAGAACLLGGIFVFASLSAQAEVFINEIHYDDADTPTCRRGHESVEVVATAGEDLTLYDIVLIQRQLPTVRAIIRHRCFPAGCQITCGINVQIAVVNYPTTASKMANDALPWCVVRQHRRDNS